jgi:hypothetical protein
VTPWGFRPTQELRVLEKVAMSLEWIVAIAFALLTALAFCLALVAALWAVKAVWPVVRAMLGAAVSMPRGELRALENESAVGIGPGWPIRFARLAFAGFAGLTMSAISAIVLVGLPLGAVLRLRDWLVG